MVSDRRNKILHSSIIFFFQSKTAIFYDQYNSYIAFAFYIEVKIHGNVIHLDPHSVQVFCLIRQKMYGHDRLLDQSLDCTTHKKEREKHADEHN